MDAAENFLSMKYTLKNSPLTEVDLFSSRILFRIDGPSGKSRGNLYVEKVIIFNLIITHAER